MRMVWRAKSKAKSAYVTGEGGTAGNVMKFSEICERGEQSGRRHRSSSATVFIGYKFLAPLRRLSRAAGSKIASCAWLEGRGL